MVSAYQLKQKHFERIDLPGQWGVFIGRITTDPFSWLIYGGKGSGKSTFAIRAMKFFAETLHWNILFVAHEESTGATLKDKLERENAFLPNIHLTDRMPMDSVLKNYNCVVLDSVNSMRMPPEEFNRLRKLGKSVGFGLWGIFQANMDGSTKGGSEYGHDVDIVTQVDQGTARHEKNRYGGEGLFSVFESGNFGVTKFTSLTTAVKERDKLKKQGSYAEIMKGDDNKFWIVNFEQKVDLMKKGYKCIKV